MKTDILIAGLMVTFSVATLLGLIMIVVRAVREEPRTKIKASPESARMLRPASGW
jgi:hypothetical protein